MDAVCIGNATLDVFVDLKETNGFNYDKFSNQIAFKLGEKVGVPPYVFSLGGNACNVAVGLSRLGIKTSLAAEVGSDDFSQKIVNTLQKEKVDISNLKTDGRQTPYFNVLLSYNGERSILEEQKETKYQLKVNSISSKLTYLSGINGDWKSTYESVGSALGNSMLAINPGNPQLMETETLNKLLPNVEVLFVNLGEAQRMVGKEIYDVKEILQNIKAKGANIIVITDSTNGSYAIDQDSSIYHISPFSKNNAVERTGAGDSYASGFLYAYLSQKDAADSMAYGAINADAVIRKIGAQEGLLEKEEMEQVRLGNSSFKAVKI